MLDAREVVVFAAATACKAWEPLAVAMSQQQRTADAPPFAMLLVACEAVKLVSAVAALLVLQCTCRGIWSVLTFRCAASAVLLAVCNHCLGFALHRIDALLYQVVFKAISVAGVAICSRLILQHRIRGVQYASLAALFVGMHLCVEQPPSTSADVDGREWAAGLWACILGSLALAVSAVLFEGATQAKPGSCLQHVAAYALLGLAANTLALCVMHWQLMTTHPARATGGMGACDAIATLSIAAADATMAVFVSWFSANVYSFSRALALLLSGLISTLALGQSLSARFMVGAVAVTMSAWIYREHERSAACAGAAMTWSWGSRPSRAASCLQSDGRRLASYALVPVDPDPE